MTTPTSVMPGGGETRDSPSGWTLDTMMSHFHSMIAEMDKRFEQRFVAQEKALTTAFKSSQEAANPLDAQMAVVRTQIASLDEKFTIALANADKAVLKAETANERRFDSVNEFRAQLNDQAQTFMPRKESEARHAQTSEKIDAIQSRLDRTEGRSVGIGASWGIVVAAVGVVGTVVAATIAILAFNN